MDLASRRPRRGSVLVVDDDPFARTILADAMKERGFSVIEVAGARQALSAIVTAEESPALIMTDLVMPDMDGRTLLALMRSSSPGVPIVIVSACAQGVERALEGEGAEAVVDKSWGPSTNAEIAEALLVMRGQRAA
jgi:CheY-like chemotaxis protein